MSDSDFARLSALIADQTGIKVTQSKRIHIESKLQRRAAELGLSGLAAYCRLIFDGGGLADEADTLVHLATTNKTDFFRERAHFELLTARLLPELQALGRRAEAAPIKIWSAAAANGAEAYTAAMLLEEEAAKGRRFSYAVLGTDISAEMVAHATRAIYPAAMVAPVPPALQHRYFMRARAAAPDPRVRVVPELRRRVRFQCLNLIDPSYPVDRDVDVIFLRNVLIYFAPQTQKAVVRRLAGHLRSGGYLILGHTETAIGNGMGFEQIGTGVFRVT